MKRLFLGYLFLWSVPFVWSQAPVSAPTPAQKKTYDAQGAISEIIMSSPAEIRGHFNLFFESTVVQTEENKSNYWYKIVFNRDCFFEFELFPLYENDRYSFKIYRVSQNQNFCDAATQQTILPVLNSKAYKSYNNNEQTESFRSNLVFSKRVTVTAGEAIYIVVNNVWGKDMGHIMGLTTCDYSYVLKATKLYGVQDSLARTAKGTEDINDKNAIDAISKKLCPPDKTPVLLGNVNFREKNYSVSNKMMMEGVHLSMNKVEPSKKTMPPPSVSGQPVVSQPIVIPPASQPMPVAQPAKAIVKAEDVPRPVTTPDTTRESYQSTGVSGGVDAMVVPGFSMKSVGAQKAAQLVNDKYMPVKCIVTDIEKGELISYEPRIVGERNGKKVSIKPLAVPGEYEILIEKGKSYKVECNAMGYKNYDLTVNISRAIKSGEEALFEIRLMPLKAGDNFILRNIYFHANTPVFKKDSDKQLEQLYEFMSKTPEAVISIEGHTNSNRYIWPDKRRSSMGGKWSFHGTAKKLSRNRANEVKDYLVKKGIPANRIKIKGWGGNKELYPNARSLELSQKNMRVEVHILKI